MGSVLIWILGLVGVFIIGIFAWNELSLFRVVAPIERGLPRYVDVIEIADRSSQVENFVGVGSFPAVESSPLDAIYRSSRQYPFDLNLLSRLKSELSNVNLFSLFEFDLRSSISREHTHPAFRDPSGCSSNVSDSESSCALRRDAYLKTIEIKRNSTANDDFGAILQHKNCGFYVPRCLHFSQLALHQLGLLVDSQEGKNGSNDAAQSDKKQTYVWGVFRTKETAELAFRYILGPFALYGGSFLLYYACNRSRRSRRYVLGAIAIALIAAGLGAFFLPIYWHDDCNEYRDCQVFQHNSAIVPPKYIDNV